MEETPASSPSGVVSSQMSLPTTQDPGWNDPPEWALSSQYNSSGATTRRLLNKRVAFPLSSQTSSPEKAAVLPSSPNMPPILQPTAVPTITTAPHKPLLAPTDKDCAKTPQSNDNFDKDQALMEILTTLESVMTEQKMEEDKVKEIRRRLDTMRSNWLENKLNDTVQKNILDMSRALLRKDIKEADKIHVTLMMQHATVCRTWMPAIRHIIFELKKECDRSNVLQPEQSPLLFVDSKKN